MLNSNYKIYNASAGSGKTFTLAKSYLKLLVASKSPDQFKSILALTFTNKAVGEMKERIVEMLKLFSSEEILAKPHTMFKAICDELSISPEHLHNKSKHLLKHIIHNYGAFDISTIDGFTHRVIRTFAYDLNLPVNFEVELDQERLLNEAVDSLIAKAGTDKYLTRILIDFALEKADDDKSWDISFDFNKISKLLTNENDVDALFTLKDKTLEDFKVLKVHLNKNIKLLENTISEIAKASLKLIAEKGIDSKDFSRESLPKHFTKLSLKEFNISFDSVWQIDLIEGRKLYPTKVNAEVAASIEAIQPNLSEAFTKTKALIYDLKLNQGFYKNITPLSVLNAIKNELRAITSAQNKMLISEFNKIISKEIKDQPTPFIYERLGEKFKHYFIDEFQDTSRMQWENLVPLLDNSLSATIGSTMLVGDAKQAIYRWRGGEAEQFIELYNQTSNPFQIEAEVLPLETNYRSAKTIVNFNNLFFDYLSSHYFDNEAYAELYKNAKQHTNSTNEGYVNLSFLDIQKDDDASELYASRVFETINQCLVNGFELSDICVLVRKRKEGVSIAKYLSENDIKITSSETLLLKSSETIQFISAFLKLLIQPNNDSLKVEVLWFLAEQRDIQDKHLFFQTYLKPELEDMLQGLKPLDIEINKGELLQLPLYELVEQTVRTFKLNTSSDAYLQYYMDVVLEFAQKQNADLAAFIVYFENKQDKLSIVSPEHKTAVNIMTIHKSKGLEFPAVIFPYADLNIYNEIEPKIWFPVNAEAYNGFETLLLNYNKDVEHFGDLGTTLYQQHQSELELDNINLLYVVLTRAVEQLYVISKKDFNAKGVLNESTYAGMLISFLQQQGQWQDDKLTYHFGELKTPDKSKEIGEATEPLQFISVSKEAHNLNIITKAGLLWDTKQEKAIERGNLVHLVLSKIKTIADIEFAFDDFSMSGDITKSHAKDLKKLVSAVLEHPQLSTYYNNDDKIYNESDIITKSGELMRPDRLNINSLNEVVIIDYKTGEKKPFHKAQLHQYEAVLNLMKLTVARKILVYINDSVDVIEV